MCSLALNWQLNESTMLVPRPSPLWGGWRARRLRTTGQGRRQALRSFEAGRAGGATRLRTRRRCCPSGSRATPRRDMWGPGGRAWRLPARRSMQHAPIRAHTSLREPGRHPYRWRLPAGRFESGDHRAAGGALHRWYEHGDRRWWNHCIRRNRAASHHVQRARHLTNKGKSITASNASTVRLYDVTAGKVVSTTNGTVNVLRSTFNNTNLSCNGGTLSATDSN